MSSTQNQQNMNSPKNNSEYFLVTFAVAFQLQVQRRAASPPQVPLVSFLATSREQAESPLLTLNSVFLYVSMQL